MKINNDIDRKKTPEKVDRRQFLGLLGKAFVGAAGMSLLGPLGSSFGQSLPGEKGIVITDIKVATLRGLNSTSRIVRLDTNKGISGYGECRVEDRNSQTELNKCAPVILGMNPSRVDQVFDTITALLNPTANWTQITYASGAIAAIECACWDITGKIYNVPIWKLLGPKLRDGMRMYCDTPSQRSISAMQYAVEERVNKGFTWFKTDLDRILSSSDYTTSPDPNPYTASGGRAQKILDSGYTKWMDYISAYRGMIGDYPLGADHFFAWSPSGGGLQLDVASAIKTSNILGAPEYMNSKLGGWMEDIIPWHYYDELAQIKAGTDMSILTGEDIFGVPLLRELVDADAIDIFHPDPATFGGIQPTLQAALYAHSKGVKTAFHMSNGPIALIMNAHISAAIPEFLSCEHHYTDVSWYDSLLDGIPKPIMGKDGFLPIPEGPGLGVTINEDVLRQHGTWFA
ncbi:MAG: mandelate racemase/muconate lactonizing enzyme family protein [Spirochaetales bacterium]|nr:mandelate racemase/muconate lactonizing enzyme family protein [Spirochaetales bacterium]